MHTPVKETWEPAFDLANGRRMSKGDLGEPSTSDPVCNESGRSRVSGTGVAQECILWEGGK